MARDSSGSKNQPIYLDTGVPADAADLTEVAAYAALTGNRKVGTNAERIALTGADVWDGLVFYETDTTISYLRVGLTWLPLDPVAYTPTLTNITIGNGTVVAYVWYTSPKACQFEIILTCGSTTSASGTLGFSPPATPADVGVYKAVGSGVFLDTSTGDLYPIDTRISTSGNITAQLRNNGTTYDKSTNMNGTLPVALGTGDVLHLAGSIRLA